VQGSQIGKVAECGKRIVVDDDRLGELVPPVHHPVPHGLDLRQIADGADLGIQKSLHDQLDGLPMMRAIMLPLDFLPAFLRVVIDERASHGDPLDDARGEHFPFFPAVQLVLQGRASAVEGEDVHSKAP